MVEISDQGLMSPDSPGSPWVSFMSFSWENKFGTWSHTWLHVDDFMVYRHFLSLTVSLKYKLFECNFLLAAIVKFFQGAGTCNRQI